MSEHNMSPSTDNCPECGGSGLGDNDRLCVCCNGRGWIEIILDDAEIREEDNLE